jgi:hypothetical protein
MVAEKPPGLVAKHLLVVGKVEIHLPASFVPG